MDYTEREMEVHCIVGTQAGKNLTSILKGYSGCYVDYYLQEGKVGARRQDRAIAVVLGRNDPDLA